MRTIHLLVILLVLTAGNGAAVPLRVSTKDRVSALTHTPERLGFFGREKVCSHREACASIAGSRGSEDRPPR
ncbi:hypothetical protein EDB87DRAFT_1653487 [Lactarius vividus]|nr:hypothetical protein EDB87DRAFT_1653487 [Lactarius vividus]